MANDTVSEKLCKDCALVLPACSFSKDSSKKTGLCTYCKTCQKVRMDKYYAENWKKISDRANEWGRNNAERRNALAEKRRKDNRDTLLPKRRAKHNEKMKSDLGYRINHCIRSHVQRIVKRGGFSESMGYGANELIQRMEVQFKSGMSWDNYGDWEIDHKIPVSVFISRGVTDAKIVNALSNLQPMWKSYNRSKGARYVG